MTKYNWRQMKAGAQEFPEYLKIYEHWRQAVIEGAFEDVEIIHVYGHNTAVGAVREMVWHQGGVYSYLTTPTILTVASSSTDDVNLTGIGAWKVCIHTLDPSFNPQKEVVALNGQNGVNMIRPCMRVLTKHVIASGTTGWNVGDIRTGTGAIVAGVPQTLVISNAGATFNKTLLAMHTIRNGWTGYMKSWGATSSISKQVQAQVRVRKPEEPFVVEDFSSMTVGQIKEVRAAHLKLPSKTDLQISAAAVGGGGAVGAACEIIQYRNA